MSTHHYHAVVWIDHREARVFHVGAGNASFHRKLRPKWH